MSDGRTRSAGFRPWPFAHRAATGCSSTSVPYPPPMPQPTFVALPEALKRVIDGKAFAHMTTLDPDGTPQASAVWIMRDGDRIILNTAEGRRKGRNLLRGPRRALSVSDQPARDLH